MNDFAAAGNIHFDRTTIDRIRCGGQFTLEILGSAFTEGSAGGGLELRWDANILEMSSLNEVELRFPGDVFIFDKGRLDGDTGRLLTVAAHSFNGVLDASFPIAKITFTALAAGASLLELETGTFSDELLNVWTSHSAEEIANLSFDAAELTVIGPILLPAGLWLMSGALAVVGLRSRAIVRPATA